MDYLQNTTLSLKTKMFKQAIRSFLKKHKYEQIKPRVALFDMDGILFDSMPYHAKSWVHAMSEVGIPFTEYKAYLNEGRTSASTIDSEYPHIHGRLSTEEEKKQIYKFKTDHFETFPPAPVMEYTLDLAKKMKADKLICSVVTGSGQLSLIENVETHYPEIFEHDHMVTAYDVKQGKPFPEPYLMGLAKHHALPQEAIVIENAPLGVKAGVAAGIFTIAVNTGILENEVLKNAGADLVFSSMKEFHDSWEELLRMMKIEQL